MEPLLVLKEHMEEHIRHTEKLAKFRATIRFLGLTDDILSTFLATDPNTWTTLLQKVNDKIHTLCDHEWTHDDVDTDLDTSQRIVYCRRCSLEQKA
jgi:hypothetical protein